LDLHTLIPPIIILTMATVIADMITVIILMIFLLMAAPPCSPVLSAIDGLSLSVDTAVCCWSAYPGWFVQ
jgi:hypothetical protein